MKRLYPFLLLLPLAWLGACGGGKKPAEIVPQELTGEVAFPNLYLGMPMQIMFHKDVMLLRDEHDDHKALSLVDMKTGMLVGRRLSIGRGPGEMLEPFRTYIHGDRLYAHQMSTGRVSVYSLPGVEYVESFDMEGSPDSSQRMADYFVGGGAEKEGRLQIFDTEGKYLFAGGDLPDSDSNVPEAFHAVAYQGDYCARPDGNAWAFAASYSDRIEFHAIRRGRHAVVAESGTDKVLADYDDASGNARLATNVYLGSAGVWGGKEHCYLHRIDNNQGAEGVMRGFSATVRKYDWDGTPVAEYRLDRPIAFMTVDEATGDIYGLVMDEESYIRIVRFAPGA
jgi:hypothetical protein